MPARNVLTHIDGATRLLRAAVDSPDPKEALLLLRVAHAWLEVAKYQLAFDQQGGGGNGSAGPDNIQ